MSLRSLTPSATLWLDLGNLTFKELQNKNILTNYEKKTWHQKTSFIWNHVFYTAAKITFICCIESWLNQPLGKAYSHRQKNQ